LGTRKDNVEDMVKKGRQPKCEGSKSPNAKLTESQVAEIISARGKVRQVDLAIKYGVTQGLISRIHRGDGWKHVHR
jgi:hypothetical protein